MNTNVHSEEEFAKASAAMTKRSAGLSEIRGTILGQFQKCGKLYEFFLLDSVRLSFRAYVFYNTDQEINAARESGVESQIKEAVCRELETLGRGDRETVRVEFEFDSHENVQRHYGGNYYNRLH